MGVPMGIEGESEFGDIGRELEASATDEDRAAAWHQYASGSKEGTDAFARACQRVHVEVTMARRVLPLVTHANAFAASSAEARAARVR